MEIFPNKMTALRELLMSGEKGHRWPEVLWRYWMAGSMLFACPLWSVWVEGTLDKGHQENEFLFILSDREVFLPWKGTVWSQEGRIWSQLHQRYCARLSLVSGLWINWCQFVPDLQLRYIQYHLGPLGFPTASSVCSFCEWSGCKRCSFICS